MSHPVREFSVGIYRLNHCCGIFGAKSKVMAFAPFNLFEMQRLSNVFTAKHVTTSPHCKLATEFYNAATTSLQNQFSLCLLAHSELFEESDLYEPADKQLSGKALWNLHDRRCQKLASVLTKASACSLFSCETHEPVNPMNL